MERDFKPLDSIAIFLMVHVFAICGTNKCNITLYTNICPKDAIEWHNRGRQFQCDTFRNWTYHCILNNKGQLIETCIKKEVVSRRKGGCPWILEFEGKPYIGRPNTPCPFHVDGCPQKNHREYTTDFLYLYPKCLIPADQRSFSTLPVQIYPSSTKETSESFTPMATVDSNRKSNHNSETSEKGCSVAGYVAAIVVLVVVCIVQFPSFIYHVMDWRKGRKKKSKTYECGSLKEEEKELLGERCTKDQGPRRGSIESIAFRHPVDMKDSFIENEVTRQIKEGLENEGHKKPILLHGIRGSGKTCAALHCLKSLGKRFYVIEAGNKNRLRRSLKELSEDYAFKDIDHNAELKNMIELISQKLEPMNIILLMEDVMKTETLELLNPLIEKCKCIITSLDKTISYQFETLQTIQVCGFSVDETRQLFEQNDIQKSYTDEELEKLVASLNGSPFGMKSVISYMKEKNISMRRILTYITQNTQTGVLDDDKSILKVLGHFVRYIKSTYSEVSSMLLALPFLHCENIPIYLFYALAAYEADKCTSKNREDPYGKAEFVTNKFVSVLRHVSFGDVQGEDDGRKISVPKIVQYAVSQSTDHHERDELNLKLLKCMSWLFLKDHGHPRDHQRCLDLLPHATEIIRQFQTSTTNESIEMSTTLVFVQVCDQVRHTYEVLGYEFEEKKYAKCMTEYVSRNILKQSESEFLRKVCRDNAETTSTYLINLIKRIAHGKDKELSELAEDYIQFKVRSNYDITNIRKELGEHAVPLTQRLSCAEIALLKKRNLIISDSNLLAYVFVYEILMSTLRVFGQYALQHDKDFETYKSFVYLTQCFAQHRMLRNYLSVRAVGIELIGIRTLRLKEHETGAPGAMQNLNASIRDVEQLRSNDRKYFKYGLYVLCPKENVDLRLRCHSVLLEYYRACKEQTKASTEAKALQKMFAGNLETVKAAPHSQRVKQILVEYLMENKEFENAKAVLRNCPHHLPSQTISKYDCKDILLLFQCYENLIQIEEMKELWTKVTFNIPRDEEAAKSIVKRIQDIADKHLHKD